MQGEVIAGRYRIVEALAEGASSTVYRAVIEPGEGSDQASGQTGEAVAVKILKADHGTRDQQRRFEREAMATGLAEHPNVVRVRDYGALEDGRPYIVMDLLEGRTLADLLAQDKTLPVARALHILEHVLRGLGHAHQMGVIHRDLKPADILLVADGDDRDFAKLMDFGTAALLGDKAASAEQLTRAGIALGSPAYMAPERLGSDPVDGRADLYSASCMLFEMISGAPPFAGADPQTVLKAHLSSPIPKLSEVVKGEAGQDIPPGLDELLIRGLGKDPAHRFASAEEFLAAIEQQRAGGYRGAADASAPGPGGLAQPDKNRSTTVWHGAPEQIRQAAAELTQGAQRGGVAPAAAPPAAMLPAPHPQATATAAGRSPAAAPISAPPPATSGDVALAPAVALGALDGPSSPSMTEQPPFVPPAGGPQPPIQGGPLPPHGGPLPHGRPPGARDGKKGYLLVGAAVFALVIVVVLVARGCGDDTAGGETFASVEELESAWRGAGLEPGGFAKIDGAALGGGDCQAGAVSGLDVTVCSYPVPEQATEAKPAALKQVGQSTGAAIVSGQRLLIVADRKTADPSGRAIDKLIKVFQGKPAERSE